jgi:hypothetical protein
MGFEVDGSRVTAYPETTCYGRVRDDILLPALGAGLSVVSVPSNEKGPDST